MMTTDEIKLIGQFFAQKVDMFIGSFVDIGFGTAYVLKIDEDGYQQASSDACCWHFFIEKFPS